MKISPKDISTKNLFLIASFTLVLLLSSCNFLYKFTPGYWKWRSEFKKEREFIQKILDNPYQMQAIVESSEFYDKDVLNMGELSYSYWIRCLIEDRGGTKPDVIGFNRSSIDDGKGNIRYENSKCVYVFTPNAQFNLIFVFVELGGKTLLFEIWSLTR